MDNSVVSICDESKNLKGTGFVIDLNDDGAFVVTCAHVIEGCKSAIVNGYEAIVTKDGTQEGYDLALLFVKGLNIVPIRISVGDQDTPERVVVTGFSSITPGTKLESINVNKLKRI